MHKTFIYAAMSAATYFITAVFGPSLAAQSEYGTVLASQIEYWNCVQQQCDPLLEGEEEKEAEPSKADLEAYENCKKSCYKKAAKRIKLEENNLQVSSSWMMRPPTEGVGGGPNGPTPPPDDPCAVTGGFNTGWLNNDEPPTGGVSPVCVPNNELSASRFGIGNLQWEGSFEELVFFDLRTQYGQVIAEAVAVDESGGGILFSFEDGIDYEGVAVLTYYPEGNPDVGIPIVVNLY